MAIEPPMESATKPAKQSSPTALLGACVLAGILALSLLVWAQGARTAAVRREAFGRGVDGIAPCLSLPVAETNTVRFENRGQRLQSIVENIQKAGGYESVVVTDKDGNVIATTDSGVKDQVVKDMMNPKSPAVVRDVDGSVEATVAIYLQGTNVSGALRIRTKL